MCQHNHSDLSTYLQWKLVLYVYVTHARFVKGFQPHGNYLYILDSYTNLECIVWCPLQSYLNAYHTSITINYFIKKIEILIYAH
jgi:hypothetical protein